MTRFRQVKRQGIALLHFTGGIFCQPGLHGSQDARPQDPRNECTDVASGEESEHRAGGSFCSPIDGEDFDRCGDFG